ncbi:MAG TPA: 50S ribosomal protein L21 [Chloroflexi bacterium]|nr:50S ribosomal protein L21 [Chloroflexota bacterium]
MYAIVSSGGKQFKVSKGDVLDVALLPAEAGSQIELEQVLMIGGEQGVTVGKPLVEGAKVTATVQNHGRGKKIIVYKHKKNYKRKQGHRQDYTRLQIDDILV